MDKEARFSDEHPIISAIAGIVMIWFVLWVFGGSANSGSPYHYESDEELQAAEDHYQKEMDETIKEQQAEEQAATEGEELQERMDEDYDSLEWTKRMATCASR